LTWLITGENFIIRLKICSEIQRHYKTTNMQIHRLLFLPIIFAFPFLEIYANSKLPTALIFVIFDTKTDELYFWTLSIVWCLKKLRNKIYIPKITIHTSQNSHKGQLLTTEPLTWVHTQHKPLKQVRRRWQQMTQPLHTSQLLKPGKHKYRIQTN
jgi:hypothetical protein